MSGPLATTVIAHTDNASLPDDSRFEQWSGAAYLGKDASGVCILLVDEPESRTLNARYRGHDKPTNVLSFPMRLPEHLGALALGDLVICAPVVEREAREQGRAVLAHWAHMVVHGMLHLQGYDHESESGAAVMETLEARILNKLGFDDPYTGHDRTMEPGVQAGKE
jgi:probable rRNA maturation factor